MSLRVFSEMNGGMSGCGNREKGREQLSRGGGSKCISRNDTDNVRVGPGLGHGYECYKAKDEQRGLHGRVNAWTVWEGQVLHGLCRRRQAQTVWARGGELNESLQRRRAEGKRMQHPHSQGLFCQVQILFGLASR